jgi:hypothetical protein
MSSSIIAKYVTPWKFRREEEQRRLHALRARDGDDCRRCRRPLRFDLPRGHDMGPQFEAMAPFTDGAEGLDHLCLTHRRCNASGADHTDEVQERIRRKAEAELLSRPKRVKRRA